MGLVTVAGVPPVKFESAVQKFPAPSVKAGPPAFILQVEDTTGVGVCVGVLVGTGAP